MKDIFGRPLAVDQTVAAAIQPFRNRYDLVSAEIIGFTPKMVRILRAHDWKEGEYEEQLVSPYKLALVTL